ncbi:tripartite tricarboxylate transporter TctB family protein [Falsirhodobacter halotolerans]|uniref:tripartite tricarboxylate transporter TctB family protein n=1 Tax=Falsirhodobacter halotolerans TaxID=1146892 RepID=UPI001FD18FD3|nr:tripartite tricarboxylate transporter TctB family protein [Falsirhodobacter halotolerans]MCJ8139868.1 tripartite tricarboxylate transporter TctB family protein [Falsirhodobacter halotolerans]
MRTTHLETGAAALTLICSIAGMTAAWSYSGTSGLMPRAVLGICIALSLVWLGQSLSKMRTTQGAAIHFHGPTVMRFCVTVGGTALVIVGTAMIGFFTTAIVLLPLMAVAIGYRDPVRLAIGTLAFIGLLYSVFHLLLKIPLPPEAILSRLG